MEIKPVPNPSMSTCQVEEHKMNERFASWLIDGVYMCQKHAQAYVKAHGETLPSRQEWLDLKPSDWTKANFRP